jgi:hypothetical protein
MIPFKPESIDSLKDRFCDALIDSYDVEEVRKGNIDAPSGQGQHIFDFEDGLRMIVSRDVSDGQDFIHISGSFGDERLQQLSLEDGLAQIVKKYAMLSGDKSQRKMDYYVSEAGVVHLLFKNERSSK